MSSKVRISILLFCVSLIIRIIFLFPFVFYNIPLMFDEIHYFDRAVGYMNILSEVTNGHIPSRESIERAYGMAEWPPLQPFILGLGFFLFGKYIIVGRSVMILISALTSVVLYHLSLRLTNEKTAIFTALIHAFYPTFIAYSTYLMSETTYTFFLLLSIFFAVKLLNTTNAERKIRFSAILCGLSLGLCGLTRPAVLPFLVIIPFWVVMYIREKKFKKILAGTIIASYLTLLLPWQTALFIREKTPGFLSDITGWYMHLGNNPWVPEGYGSSWQHNSRMQMIKSAKEYAKEHSIGFDEAQRILALKEIKKDFPEFLKRGIYKIRMFWAIEFFPLIHLFYTAYPPVSSGIALGIFLLILISQIIVLVFSIMGFFFTDFKPSVKVLIALMVVSSMAQSFVTFAIPRFHIPLLALLLPVTAHGVINFKQIINLSFRNKLILFLTVLILLISIFTSLPLVVSGYLKPSTYYCGLISKIDKVIGSNTRCIDKVLFKVTQTNYRDTILITTDTPGYSFNKTPLEPWIPVPNVKKYVWEISPESNLLRLDIYAHNTSAQLKMKLYSERLNRSTIIRPISIDSWRRWQPTGLDNIEYMWLGGGIGVRNMLPDDKLYSFK